MMMDLDCLLVGCALYKGQKGKRHEVLSEPDQI